MLSTRLPGVHEKGKENGSGGRGANGRGRGRSREGKEHRAGNNQDTPTQYVTLCVSQRYECETNAVLDIGLHQIPVHYSINIQMQLNQAVFLKRFCKQILEVAMQKADCSVCVEDETIILTCTLAPHAANYRQQLKEWPSAARQCLDEFIEEHMAERRMDIPEHIWKELGNFIQSGKKRTQSHLPEGKARPKDVSREPDEWYIFVKNLKAGNRENVMHYIEAGTGADAIQDKLIYNEAKFMALVVLDSKPDLDRLKKRVGNRTLDGSYISASEVGPPSAIAVSSEEILSMFVLELYFESKKSGGGEIDGNITEAEDKSCYIVRFKDTKVVQSVCGRSGHHLDGKTLYVSPCYECKKDAIWDPELHPVPVQEKISIQLPHNQTEFLIRVCKQMLEAAMQKRDCSVSVEDDTIVLTCTLTPRLANYQQQLKAWPSAARQCFDDFIEEHLLERNTAVQEHVWHDFQHFIQSGKDSLHTDDRKHFKESKKQLGEKLETEYKTIKIDKDKELIKSLKKNERDALLDIDVLADISLDDKSGIITVKGPTRYVLEAQTQLQNKLRRIDSDRIEIEQAEKMCKIVKWYYEEVTITEVKLVEYDNIPNYRIEIAFKNNKKDVELFDSDGTVYVIDFMDLEEYVKGDRNDKMKVVRKDVLKSGGAELPAIWTTMSDDVNVNIVQLLQTEKEFKYVETEFLKQVKNGKETSKIQYDLNQLKVRKIERIQNKSLYQQYVAKMKLIETQKPNLPKNMPIERTLWHGTTQGPSSIIKVHGFNRSYCEVNGVWYGHGVYFALDASYSAKGWLSGSDKVQSGQPVTGWVFQVKALTGQYCAGSPNMRYLSAVDAQKPSVLYDSAVDNVQNPYEFVIFTDTQSYPEYLIEFTSVKK